MKTLASLIYAGKFVGTGQDLLGLGWVSWGEDYAGQPSDMELYLCPKSQFAAIPNGTTMHSISGGVKVKGVDSIDQDDRDGFLAWGFMAPPHGPKTPSKKHRRIDEPFEPSW